MELENQQIGKPYVDPEEQKFQEFILPETMLAYCLQKCGLTLQDVVEGKMKTIITDALEMPQSRFKSSEDYIKNTEDRMECVLLKKLKHACKHLSNVPKSKDITAKSYRQSIINNKLEQFKQIWKDES